MPEEETVHNEECAAAGCTDDEGSALEWKCHPVKRRPMVSVLVTVFIMVVGVLVHYATESRLLGMLAAIVLLASLAKFYFPTVYRLSDRGVTVKTTTQTLTKPWSMYRSFYPDKNGVLLSPFGRPSRLETFRGIYLMFNNNRDEVIAFITPRLTTARDNADQRQDGQS
jgi:hypothetical protein